MTNEEKKLSKAIDLVNQVWEVLDTMDLTPITSRAESLIETIKMNVDNQNLTDLEFREFIRRSI